MKKLTLIFLLFLISIPSFAQTEKFSVNDHEFEITTEVISNDWETKDTLQKLYRIEEGAPKYLLKFYKYKDNGGDCNNLFWDKETLEVIDNHIIFTTHYLQKTGIDPIPEWRKQIYEVNGQGKLILTSDLYKYYFSSECVEE